MAKKIKVYRNTQERSQNLKSRGYINWRGTAGSGAKERAHKLGEQEVAKGNKVVILWNLMFGNYGPASYTVMVNTN